MNKEAMKLALEAMEFCMKNPNYGHPSTEKAITALREALAEQPAQHEPVAYGMWDTMLGKGNRMMMVRLDRGQDGCTVPLYASPPAQRKPLTVEEIEALLPEPDGTAEVDSVRVLVAPGLYGTEYSEADAWTKESVIQVARAIEAKLKEKNT